MTPLSYFAVTDPKLEETELILIGLLLVGAVTAMLYIRKLRREINHHRALLEDQSRLNKRLDRVVDRMLRIDAEGGIDGKHRKD